MSLIRPTLNINGSSADDLIESRVIARRHLQQAIDVLLSVMPNGRDYPGDNDACVADRTEMYRRIGLLAEMQDDLLQEAIAIKNQLG